MASRQMVQEMVASLASIYNRSLSDPLVDGFYQVLRSYSEGAIARAAHAYMDEGTKMPTPSDIKQRLPATELKPQADYFMDTHKCGLCGHYGLCIKEEPYSDTWRCRQCYTGLTAAQHAAKMREIINAMGIKGV